MTARNRRSRFAIAFLACGLGLAAVIALEQQQEITLMRQLLRRVDT